MNQTPIDQASDIAATLELGAKRTIARRRSLIIIGIVAVAAAVSLWFWSRDGQDVRYATVKAERGALSVTVTATGTLQPTNQVDVGSELSGTVKAVEVDYNDRVKTGQVLARLDTAKLESQVVQSESALSTAKSKVSEAQASLQETRREFLRNKDLFARHAASDKDLVAADAAYKKAQATLASANSQVAQAKATLAVDRTNLAKAVIRSPIEGMVLARKVEPGQTVAASFQAPVLFTLAEDLTKMELHVDVDEADVGQVKAGQDATFTVDAYPDRRFPSKIAEVRYAPKTVSGVVTYETLLTVDNGNLLLRPGMTGTADITVQRAENVLLVPNTALRFKPPQQAEKPDDAGGGSFVSKMFPRPPRGTRQTEQPSADRRHQRLWTLRQGALVAIPVTLGASDGRKTEIRAGEIEPGMEIVTDILGPTK
jgi:HlyD family secretion protein